MGNRMHPNFLTNSNLISFYFNIKFSDIFITNLFFFLIFNAEENVKLYCNETCDGILQNARCNEESKICECVEEFPVQLHIGCTKRKILLHIFKF